MIVDTPIFRLIQVRKSYQQREVLSIDRLDIEPGEFFAIVGPSGAGKSTLLRLLNFLEPVTGGNIFYAGQKVKADEPVPLDKRRQITMVFQRPYLLNLNVQENIGYGLRLRGVKTPQEQVQKVIDRLGLANLARQPTRSLSGGEAQRVALARALVLQPRVLLLDEPTANLDPYNVALIEAIISELNKDRQTTVIMVTHNVLQARRLAQRTALILEGRLIECTETERFFNQPSDPRTTAFISGDMIY